MDNKLNSKANTVSAYGTRMVDLYFLLDLRIETLYSFADESVVAPLRGSHGAHVYNAFVVSLSADVVRDLYSLLLDKASETLSVRNVWTLVQQPGLLPELRKRFALADCERAAWFDAAVGRLTDAVPKLLESPRLSWLADVRHKSVAHREMKVWANGGSPQIDVHNFKIDRDELRTCLVDAQPIVQDLGLVATTVERNWGLYRQVHRLFVADFWSRLQGRGAVNDLPEDASLPR